MEKDNYATPVRKRDALNSVEAIYPGGKMFTKKFGGVAWGSSESYLDGLEKLLDDLEKYKR